MNSQPADHDETGRLREFELMLDPRHPEKCRIPTRVLGFGEISTVLDIDFGDGRNLAYKRMPMFRSIGEFEAYAKLYRDYLKILGEEIGLNLVAGSLDRVEIAGRPSITAYIVQEKLPAGTIGNQLIHSLSDGEILRLAEAVVRETAKVFDFNARHRGRLEVAIDGQISNWAVPEADPASMSLPAEIRPVYFDTSSPFVTRDGIEQLDPELFLRSAPSLLVWLLRLLFLQDVMRRYYDLRRVCIDLIANFHKERRSDLVPVLVESINCMLSARQWQGGFRPLTVAEIDAYYRKDATIWRLYLAFRKADRWLHRLARKPYPYILPEKIER